MDVSSVYVLDLRPAAAATLGAVRVFNGRRLPGRGLTIATASPLYTWGDFNQLVDANLGTTNTLTTLPASLAGDAITILSTNWSDANSHLAISSRVGAPTTVNSAILAGAVPTSSGHYGGGMENFPRFLESWGKDNPFTYNGSMVKMFPSLYATNFWGTGNVYAPPARNWAYDHNFDNGAKLPPLTPGLLKTIRSVWATVPPNQTTPPVAGFLAHAATPNIPRFPQAADQAPCPGLGERLFHMRSQSRARVYHYSCSESRFRTSLWPTLSLFHRTLLPLRNTKPHRRMSLLLNACGPTSATGKIKSAIASV